MNPASGRKALAYLYKFVEAGEKGYAVVASNVRNRAKSLTWRLTVCTTVDLPRASKAWQIMKQIVMADKAGELCA